MRLNNPRVIWKYGLLSLGLLLLVGLSFFGCSSQESHTTYHVQEVGLSKAKITNKVDGYTVVVPKNMQVDMTMNEIRMVLENDEERIEIYRQELDPQSGMNGETYSGYSNKFLENTIEYTREFSQKITLGNNLAMVEQWSREPLKRVENDKNHYASVDIMIGEEECVTFLFKSNKPYEQAGESRSYLDLVNTFRTVEKTAKAEVKVITTTENKSWNKETTDTFEKYFGKNAKLTWGMFEREAPLDFAKLENIENQLEFQFPILLYYTGFIEGEDSHPRLATALKNADEKGRLLELTLQTLSQDESKGNMVYDVLNGEYDQFLKNYVKDVKDYGKPVLFRVGNEMNGDWCVYSAYHTSKDTEIYKSFYKYIHGLFQEAGADNVIWIWNPNARSFPDFKWNDAQCYFPGSDYVDVVGMTAYNTGNYYEGEIWEDFATLYDETYSSYEARYELPLMITEFASSSVGGDKVKWINDMFDHIKNYDNLKVALWWSSCDLDGEGKVARPYFIDETPAVVETFKAGLKDYK